MLQGGGFDLRFSLCRHLSQRLFSRSFGCLLRRFCRLPRFLRLLLRRFGGLSSLAHLGGDGLLAVSDRGWAVRLPDWPPETSIATAEPLADEFGVPLAGRHLPAGSAADATRITERIEPTARAPTHPVRRWDVAARDALLYMAYPRPPKTDRPRR